MDGIRILLVGNYPLDRQQSMLRWARLLADALPPFGCQVIPLAPRVHFGRFAGNSSLAKWLGHIDKYLLFPRELRAEVAQSRRAGVFVTHVADHSNAVYIPHRNCGVPWIVTCHDLIAVGAALGENTGHRPSFSGYYLQRAVVRGLGRASSIVADSTSTLADLDRLIDRPSWQRRFAILLGLNFPYRPIDRPTALKRLADVQEAPWEKAFLFHIGANGFRKNKDGVLRIFAEISDRWSGNLIFCGDAFPPELRSVVVDRRLDGRVFCVRSLSDVQLEAAYSLAHALLFPSRFEGFGWPVIEAQACGCPVITSDRTSLPEIGGDASLVYRLDDEDGMAGAVLRLDDPVARAAVVARGLRNVSRFDVAEMARKYVAVYHSALAQTTSRSCFK